MMRNLLTFDATAQLMHALITTHLDVCNRILYNLSNNKIDRLQSRAARMLKRVPRRIHITPVLRELDPNGMGLTLAPKLTYSTHIHNISVQAHKPLQMMLLLFTLSLG